MVSFPRRRNSLRASGWDYRSPGAYLITICVAWGAPALGHVNHGKVRLSELGQSVEAEWTELPRRFSGTALDSLVVMPDHLHSILWIVDPTARNAPSTGHGPPAGSVGAVVGQWKSRVTKAAQATGLWPVGRRLRHRGYHDRLLRSELAVVNARAYIEMNPIRWERDRG